MVATEISEGTLPPVGLIVAARIPAAIGLIHAALEDHLERPYPSSRRYGERFLQLMHDGVPTPEQVKAFEVTQILQLDHSFNAGTFAARVVSSTLAPPSSALSAAIGALYGALHGGADQAALEMALEVADYAYILEMGAIVAQGSGAELEADTRVQEAYLSL